MSHWGKVPPALQCYILPFPPCTYFPSDINGRGILREDKGSTRRNGKGEPFPGLLGDGYQAQHLGEVIMFLYLHWSLSKHSIEDSSNEMVDIHVCLAGMQVLC